MFVGCVCRLWFFGNWWFVGNSCLLVVGFLVVGGLSVSDCLMVVC